jgi:hypothetical protein
MFDPDNLKAMGCAAPNEKIYCAKINQPGGVYYPGDDAIITVRVAPGQTPITSLIIGVQEISTRHGKLYDKPMGWSMTPPPIIEVLGKRETIEVPVKAAEPTGAASEVEVKLPLPQRYGCYVVTVAPNGKDPQLLCSALRALKPVDGFRTDVPMLAEASGFIEGGLTQKSRDDMDARRARSKILTRLGIKVVRWELPGMWGWKKDNTIDWKELDSRLPILEAAGVKTIVTLGAVSYDAMPFHGPVPSVIDWMQDCTPDDAHLPEYGRWVREFCTRFGKKGQGTLWAMECWNEPWEPMSTSGWQSDSIEYRKVFAAMADNVHKADAGVKTVTACSIMNVEDKFLTGADRADWLNRIDMFSDHYVMPPNNYASMVGRKYGKDIIETETWGASTEMLAIQFVTQFLACGDKMIDPMQTPMMYYHVPGDTDEVRFPKPSALAANVLNVFLTGRPFEKMLFLKHLPFAFQFGKDPDSVVILLGRMRPNLSAFGGGTRDSIWWQLNQQQGGTLSIDNSDGQIEVYDMAGNRAFVGEKSIVIPLDLQGWYLRSPKGGTTLIQERLSSARLEGIRPVEIIAHDFGSPVESAGAKTVVTLHNLMNRPISGKLTITPPQGMTLKSPTIDAQLAPGESKDFDVEIVKATASPANVYDFAYAFDSDAGKADWKETLHVLLVKKETKKIDGDLDDWKDDLAVPVRATAKMADATLQAWQPFNKFVETQPDGSFAELKAAYDDQYFYISARVNDPASTAAHLRLGNWDQDQYFYSGETNVFCESFAEYQKCLDFDPKNAAEVARVHKEPNWPAFEKIMNERPDVMRAINSGILRFYWSHKRAGRPIDLSQVPHVYKKDFAPDSPYNGNALQFAFNVIPGYEGHDVVTDTDRVPEGFHAMPDTDYEYAAYVCTDGGAELWRLLAPGVPRGHYFPRQMRGKIDQGPVTAGKCVVKRTGNITVYEVAIPWSELHDWHPKPGQTFGFTFCINKDKGPALVFGEDKSITKTNGLTMHPYWSGQPSCTVQWTLGK